ncbi:MAG: AmmeMemoRadiSam system protein B [Candidatus Korarchaeota archaeon]
MSTRIRKPYVSGQFYPNNPSTLRKYIKDCYLDEYGPKKLPPGGSENVLGVVSPHAGYYYSGPIAAWSYLEISSLKPEVVVIFGLSHEGYPGAAVLSEYSWETPLGRLEPATELAREISTRAGINDDIEAHMYEHSIEVQLPFLQDVYSHEFRIVPISIGMVPASTCEKIGIATAEAIKSKELEKKTILIASTDMTHYGWNYGFAPAGHDTKKGLEFAHKIDKEAANAIARLDATGFLNISSKTTVCGRLPVATMIHAAKSLGAREGKILAYATSSEIRGGGGDLFVGYLSLAIYR